MIIDRNWNKKEQKLVISYVDKLGNRQFYNKYLHHIKTYEYDTEGTYENWNGRPCKRVYKDTLGYQPNEFDILEYMYEMDPEINKALHAQYFPKLYTYDIETEVSDEFPDPEKAEQKVTSISLVGPDLSCIVYGLHKLESASIQLFRERYLDWVKNNEFAQNFITNKLGGKQPKVLYQYFETEEDLLIHFFTKIMPNVPAIAGWNSYNFDWNYLTHRVEKLMGKGELYNLIRKASPTGELSNITYTDQAGLHYRLPSPLHVANLDYMELVKSYDYTLRPYESYGLDWVGSHAVGANKIKYDGTLQQLYENDPEWYYFYNAVDSLLVQLIHKRLKSLESPCAVDSITLVPLMGAMGQIALTTANVFQEFYNDGKHVVWDYDAIDRVKIPYEGAFCGCVPGKFDFNVCFDFASLYPRQIRSCNLSFENFMQKLSEPDMLGRRIPIEWCEDELNEFRKDPNYFVTIMGNVYRNDKDYAFKRLQIRLQENRNKYKYTGQRIDSELLVEIDNMLNSTPKYTKFSDDIIKLLDEEFNKTVDDLYLSTAEELISLRREISELRDEYTLLELGAKTLMNAAYGASASPFFYFFNVKLAGDITGECRNLTKSMNDNLIKWFHEVIWLRKDLWKEFDFELDESKHDWYREQPIWIYSDTDSSYVTFGSFFKCMTPEYQKKYATDRAKVEWILNYCKKFQDKQNTRWCEEIYNPRHGNNVHEFELETIVRSQINLKKKKYLKGYAFVKGKFYDKPKVSGTGIELIKSTTPKLCRGILKDLMESLLFEYDETKKSEYIMLFNDKLRNYRREFYNAEYEDISQSVGIGNYKKFVIDDTDTLTFEKGCPVSVHSIARFNYLAHKNGEDNLKLYSGKIKYYNITINPAKKVTGYFGFPSGELPSWRPEMDKLTQWQKNVIDPINRFLEVLNVPLVNATNTIQFDLFG